MERSRFVDLASHVQHPNEMRAIYVTDVPARPYRPRRRRVLHTLEDCLFVKGRERRAVEAGVDMLRNFFFCSRGLFECQFRSDKFNCFFFFLEGKSDEIIWNRSWKLEMRVVEIR